MSLSQIIMSYYYPGAFTVFPEDTIFFVTTTVIDWIDVFTRDEYKRVIAESLDYCRRKKGLCIYGWVLMTNHLHMIVSHKIDNEHLAKVIGDFKKFTAKKVIKAIIDNPQESRKRWLLEHFKERNINENHDASCSRSNINTGEYVPVKERSNRELSEDYSYVTDKDSNENETDHYHLWQRGYDSYCITNIRHLRQKMDYLHANPVRAGIVDNPMYYCYCSYPNYCGKKGLFEIDNLDLGLTNSGCTSKWIE